MGNCPAYTNPDTTNYCDDRYAGNYVYSPATDDYQVIDNATTEATTFVVPGSCAASLPTALGVRDVMASEMEGGSDEWLASYSFNVGPCGFIGSDLRDYLAPGCCNGGCAVVGSRIQVHRKAYRGNPTNCCFNDVNYTDGPIDPSGTTRPAGCWAGPSSDARTFLPDYERNYTCAPPVRDITAGDCPGRITNYCLGTDLDPSDPEIFKRWFEGQQPCSYYANRIMYPDWAFFQKGQSIQKLSEPPTTTGFATVRQLMGNLLDRYETQGYQLGAIPGTSQYTKYQDQFRTICQQFPGLCADTLAKNCASYTAHQLSLQPGLVDWCGCHLAASEYQQYVSQYQINRECTPLCGRPDAIPYPTEDGLGAKMCQQDVCVIDDIAITLVNTTVGGSLSFGQLCGGCSGSCRCIFSDIDITAVNAKINGNLKFVQNCAGAVPQCTVTQSDGTAKLVPCGTNTAGVTQLELIQDGYVAAAAAKRNYTTVIIIILAILAIILICVFIYLLFKPKYTGVAIKLPSYDLVTPPSATSVSTLTPATTLTPLGGGNNQFSAPTLSASSSMTPATGPVLAPTATQIMAPRIEVGMTNTPVAPVVMSRSVSGVAVKSNPLSPPVVPSLPTSTVSLPSLSPVSRPPSLTLINSVSQMPSMPQISSVGTMSLSSLPRMPAAPLPAPVSQVSSIPQVPTEPQLPSISQAQLQKILKAGV